MTQEAKASRERTRRFRDAALPHLDAVYNYALLLTRNETDAEDAVQECYLLALRHFDGFRGGCMKAWLRTIVRNVCYADFARRARREQPVDLSEEEVFNAGPLWTEAQATPEAILQRRQDDAAVHRFIEDLPAPFREALILRELQELSYQEIAVICRAPVGTVMSRLARARTRLRAAWTSAEAGATPAAAGSRLRCAARS